MNRIREGRAEILAPAQSLTRKSEAFYNPAMEYQRDLTMSALRVFQKMSGKRLAVCDPLAGTGIRSIRILKEVGNIERIVMNDRNPKAVEIMKKNVENNPGSGGAEIVISNKNANMLFLENRSAFDYIDIDPFGSPLRFISDAGQALRPKSLLACTATDTGALCGSFASTCLGRYGIKVCRTDFFKELGVRVLATSTMLELSGQGMAFEPLYTHANHYFRVIGLAKRSRSALTAQMKRIRFVAYCSHCLYRSSETAAECPVCGKKLEILGPLWTGKIRDAVFCRKMLEDLRSGGYRKTKELEAALAEIDEPFYYDTPKLFRLLKRTPQKIGHIMDDLRKMGYDASRTHLCPTGIKTDAPHPEVLEMLGWSRIPG